VNATITTRVVNDFRACDAGWWSELLASGETDNVFLTHPWQSAWWQTFGRGRLLLVVAEAGGRPLALAPLFWDSGMIFFTGSGGSDYLDFVGDCREPGVLEALLDTARRHVPQFLGFRFYHLPEQSDTGTRLQQAAPQLGMVCYEEGELAAPALCFDRWPKEQRPPADKTSLVRHERGFRRQGQLDVVHFRRPEEIRPQLEEFFEQHVKRWEPTSSPSLFRDQRQREFYLRVTNALGPQGWLRFTRLEWNARPVAFHFGTCYRGTYLWYKPSFDIELARLSPGEVLLRQLLLAAVAEGAHTFDFGLGDEPFKQRFATQVRRVKTWGLYPRHSAPSPPGAVNEHATSSRH